MEERWVLNGALYPTGSAVAPSAPVTAVAQATEPTAAPVARAALPTVAPRPVVTTRTDRDVRIKVARRHGKVLRNAVRAARLPKSVRRKVRYVTTRSSVTLVIKGVRTSNEHTRKRYVSRIMGELKARRVSTRGALL
jgi:hypothetical protein